MPPNLDSGSSGLSALPTSSFNPPVQEIDEDDAQRFDDGLLDSAVKPEVEAYVCLRMTIYEKTVRLERCLRSTFTRIS